MLSPRCSVAFRDIAEAAGFSQGAFYSNFASKEELLLELMRVHIADEVQTLASFLENEFDGAEALAALERWTATMNDDAVNAAQAEVRGALVERLFTACFPMIKSPPQAA